MRRKLFFLLLLFFLVGCVSSQNFESVKKGTIGEEETQNYQIKKERIPKDYAYTQEDKVLLLSDDGEMIRRLNFQERVFVFRKKSKQSLVMDLYGNRGWVDQDLLSKRFVSDIDLPLEGVNYNLYTVKDKPYDNYTKTKGIYIAPYGEEFIDETIERMKDTPINTLVLDYHDDYGQVLFNSEVAAREVPEANVQLYEDKQGLIKKLKDKGYHLIARIVAFKDPLYASSHQDKAIRHPDGSLLVSDGLYWNSPYDRKVWEYLLDLSNEALELGFDEIQFDYIRFPDNFDSDMLAFNEQDETRAEAIQKFIMYIQANLSNKDAIISADVFGWVAVEMADVTIGQQWEAISNVVDVISPMFYPQLYGSGVFELADPQAHPYEVIKISMDYALRRNSNVKTAAIIRPWLQAWNYSTEEINEQIKALDEAGIEEYLLWDVSGDYPKKGLN